MMSLRADDLGVREEAHARGRARRVRSYRVGVSRNRRHRQVQPAGQQIADRYREAAHPPVRGGAAEQGGVIAAARRVDEIRAAQASRGKSKRGPISDEVCETEPVGKSSDHKVGKGLKGEGSPAPAPRGRRPDDGPPEEVRRQGEAVRRLVRTRQGRVSALHRFPSLLRRPRPSSLSSCLFSASRSKFSFRRGEGSKQGLLEKPPQEESADGTVPPLLSLLLLCE